MTIHGTAQEDGVKLPMCFKFILRRNPFHL